MTREQLNAIRARVEAATLGPWHVEGESYDECWDTDCEPLPMPWGLAGPTGKSLWSSGSGEYAHPDMATAEFIASAREDVPALLAEVERLKVEVGRLTAELDMEDGNLQVAVQRLTTEVVAKTQQNVALIGQNGRLQLKVERLTAEIHRMKSRPVEAEFSRLDTMWQQLAKERDEAVHELRRLTADPLPAAAWVREVERAAFARGVAAMRNAAAGWFVNDIEHASSKAHDAYQVEAHRRGDVRHADAYEDLSDATKEWDRVLCRWAAATIRALPDPEDKS